MNQGNERTTSMSKTKGLVQMAIFAKTYCSAGIHPVYWIYPIGIYKGDDHPYPGDHGLSDAQIEEGRGAWRRVWPYKFYQ